jgi:murein DD-endopeptidase MepM/ murein hydrolase activator NlpD
VFASGFVVAVIGLTLVLMIWAPWRVDRLAVSDFGARVEATAPAVGPMATARVAAPVAGTTSAAGSAAPAAPGPRPVGMPLRRNDWIIVKDYVANGGPGPTGAIDIGVVGNRDAIGTPVYATSDGTVKVVPNTRLLGNLVVVRSGRWITTYGYLDQAMVTDGQAVRRGDQIGTLGRSGQASAPMLNYQVWEQIGAEELNRNPMEFIAPR